jgi:hypothetical protein
MPIARKFPQSTQCVCTERACISVEVQHNRFGFGMSKARAVERVITGSCDAIRGKRIPWRQVGDVGNFGRSHRAEKTLVLNMNGAARKRNRKRGTQER